MLHSAGLLLLLGVFQALGFSDGSANATMSREFDLLSPDDDFKTSPPEGPPETTLNGESDSRGVFTSPLVGPLDRQKSATPGVRFYPNGRPGASAKTDQAVGKSDDAAPRGSLARKVCQYIFTVEDASECTHTSTEIAVRHVSKTVLPSKAAFDELSYRLSRLENEVFKSPASSREAGSPVVPQVTMNVKDTESDGSNSTVERTKTIPQSLIEMAKDLIEQVAVLERGIEKSAKERQDLRKQNKMLISSLHRSAASRRNFIALRTELETSIRELRDENLRLANANRTLSQQNRAIRSQRRRLQTFHETLRAKIHTLEVANTKATDSATKCERKFSDSSLINRQLEARVRNLTLELDRYMKISYEDESLQYELEKEREKNEALTDENANLKENLRNATRRIEQLTEEIKTDRGYNFSVPPPSWREQDYTHCGKITSISPPETIRAPQSYLEKYGVWMMDPLEALGDGKVWSMNTFRDKVKELKQYASLQKFSTNQPESVITLPVYVENNGGVVYNGSFYYQRRNSRKIVRYDLRLKRILKERAIHRAGFHATFAYQWGGLTDIDLAVDELGLWVIFSTRQNNGNIVISRLNPVTLRPTYTAKTSIPKRTVANAFLACGVLYTLDSYDSANASLNYEFDTIRRRARRISIPFANQHRLNAMVDYNPNTREIFSWDNSYQVKYYVTLDKSSGPTADIPRRSGGRRKG